MRGCDAAHRARNLDTHLTHGCIQHFQAVSEGAIRLRLLPTTHKALTLRHFMRARIARSMKADNEVGCLMSTGSLASPSFTVKTLHIARSDGDHNEIDIAARGVKSPHLAKSPHNVLKRKEERRPKAATPRGPLSCLRPVVSSATSQTLPLLRQSSPERYPAKAVVVRVDCTAAASWLQYEFKFAAQWLQRGRRLARPKTRAVDALCAAVLQGRPRWAQGARRSE